MARATTEAAVWMDQVSSAARELRTRAKVTAEQAWTGFEAWYDAAAVAALARELTAVSTAGQETATQLFAEYIAHVTAALSDSSRIPVPKVRSVPVRNGVNLVKVHSRPAYAFKDLFALTGDEEVALQGAVERGIRLIEDDLMLAARQGQVDAMKSLKVTRYRRVLRPEMSESGPCGLCVVASSQVYRYGELMPLHGRCECVTMSIDGDQDPGRDINREDLDRIYAAAGSTGAADLKRTRVAVSEHGELGPVLHVRGQKFTGPTELDTSIDPELGKRRLAKLNTVLEQLKRADRGGADVRGPLEYQQNAIARTTARLTV